MNTHTTHQVSDEQLYALLDNEVDSSEKARLLALIRSDEALAKRYGEMQHLKESIRLAYMEPPGQIAPKTSVSGVSYPLAASISLFFLALGASGGWMLSGTQPPGARISAPPIVMAQNSERILVHVATADRDRVQAALDQVEAILERNKGKNVTLEFIANSDAIHVLRDNSPHASEIHKLALRYRNLSFLACNVAKRNAQLALGHDIRMLPEVKMVPTAIDQILYRLKDGWTYVRG